MNKFQKARVEITKKTIKDLDYDMEDFVMYYRWTKSVIRNYAKEKGKKLKDLKIDVDFE